MTFAHAWGGSIELLSDLSIPHKAMVFKNELHHLHKAVLAGHSVLTCYCSQNVKGLKQMKEPYGRHRKWGLAVFKGQWKKRRVWVTGGLGRGSEAGLLSQTTMGQPTVRYTPNVDQGLYQSLTLCHIVTWPLTLLFRPSSCSYKPPKGKISVTQCIFLYPTHYFILNEWIQTKGWQF